jgi:secreted Zn-dependent insulinase-like peptidase
VFEYVAMLQKCGPQAWFYAELRDIENIRFRFREEVQLKVMLSMKVIYRGISVISYYQLCDKLSAFVEHDASS